MDKQPHNNLWAEKLLQVSMPDSAEAWSGMEALLDKELPQRVWSDWRRWVLLILLLLLLIGVCNCPGRGRLFHGAEIPHGAEITRGSSITHGSDIPRTATSPAGPATAASPATPAGPLTPASPASPAAPTSPTQTALGPAPPAVVKATHSFGDIIQTNTTSHTQHPGKTATHPIARPTTHKRKTTTTINSDNDTEEDHTVDDNAIPKTNAPVTSAGKDKIPASVTDKGTATGKGTDTVTKKTPIVPLLTKPPARKDTTHKKPPPPPKEKEQKEKDHGWVFGVGLNQFFPVGGQRGPTYNSNGLTGTLTDYLPVPMIRYYFNRKTYIQLEAQFNTPQPTAKNLVISQPVPDTSTRSGIFTQVSSSASIQQLYYFNIPLSIHFNPWDNLNIGTGFQWSHLSNAVGEFDSATSTSTNGNLASVVDAKSTHSFKGDTLYQQIKTNELRFLLDVNYTYKHFVLGLRYNQALSKFVNLQLPNGETTQGRNSSLQLYLRYILWDTRKKKLPAK